MKTRHGFVSNSSSSSFIVAFDKVPESQEELKVMLFGDAEVYANPWYNPKYDTIPGWSTTEVAETVWKDLQGKKPLSNAEIIEEINNGYFPGYPDPDWNATGDTPEERRLYWDRFVKQVREAAEKFYADNKSEFEGKTVFAIGYSDNDGAYFSALEHGDLFHELPHLRISHH